MRSRKPRRWIERMALHCPEPRHVFALSELGLEQYVQNEMYKLEDHDTRLPGPLMIGAVRMAPWGEKEEFAVVE